MLIARSANKYVENERFNRSLLPLPRSILPLPVVATFSSNSDRRMISTNIDVAKDNPHATKFFLRDGPVAKDYPHTAEIFL
jgi:hypothetical protein